ncbi:hypothetical protein QE382_001089 [Sphingobacterium zeae]|uniref:Uncharacterized protein n=1 Tax=Sphingobacterium zeae TaxID=1776859 RepID=A0ABU0U2C7_9SPHI|nr:hypothetical protein [Sphingobacterium zeae]
MKHPVLIRIDRFTWTFHFVIFLRGKYGLTLDSIDRYALKNF